MPFISVEMYPGRSEDQKRALVQALTMAFVDTCGGVADGVWVVIREVSRDNWAVGGTLASDSVNAKRRE